MKQLPESGIDCMQDPLFSHLRRIYINDICRYMGDRLRSCSTVPNCDKELDDREALITYLDDSNSNVIQALLCRHGMGLVYAVESVLEEIKQEELAEASDAS